MNNKQKVEAKIRELVPELSFDGMMRCADCMVSYQSKEHNHECDYPQRVLNTPKTLHLEHVLMAVEKQDWFNKTVADTCRGVMADIAQTYVMDKPFNEQEDALYDLLANILDV